MKMKNLKTLVVVCLVAGLGLTYVGLSSFTVSKITAYNLENSDGGQWKNLKVLPQDISKDSLFALMKGYNIALGVDCSFCHTQSANGKKLNFADESKKEKHYARGMISMTNEINANYFNWDKSRDPSKITDVTCAMCHRGTPNPKTYLNNIGKIAPGGEDE